VPRHAGYAEIALPNFGLPAVEPVITPEIYAARLDWLRSRARGAGLEVMIVYGDRDGLLHDQYRGR